MGERVAISVDLRYVYEDLDRHGNVRIYFWRGKGHRKIRIREIPGTDAFRTAYDDAAKTATQTPAPAAPATLISRKPQPGTLRWLCAEYFAHCVEYKNLGARTRHVRRQIIESIYAEPKEPGSSDLFADFPLERLTPKAVRVLRDRKSDKPEAANGRIKALRQVFAWAIEDDLTDLLKTNPARDVPYFAATGDGFHTWTIEEVRQFEDHFPIGTKARLALALLLFTGVRRSDVVSLGRQMIRDEWLQFTEAKGRARKPKARQIPVLPELRIVLDKTTVGNLTFLVTEFGAPFSAAGFGNWFGERCREAGVPGRAHGLRKAGATIAAENGATDRQLMAIFGWETSRQASVYTKKADRRRMAGDAMHLLVPLSEAEEGTNLSHHDDPFDPVGKKRAQK